VRDAVAAGKSQHSELCGRTTVGGREIAWSWHPDADAKPSGDDEPEGDGG
jgi:hypothetical protein